MHELSIVMGIVEIAEEQVRRNQARRVDRIDLQIGTLAGIEMSALNFAWDSAVRRTVLEGAERHIDHVQARARCLECEREFDIEQVFDPCPHCGSVFSELLKGKELRVQSLVVS